MFESMAECVRWAKETYPGCSFSVREQQDGPTMVSIKGKGDKAIRTVVYIRGGKGDDRPNRTTD